MHSAAKDSPSKFSEGFVLKSRRTNDPEMRDRALQGASVKLINLPACVVSCYRHTEAAEA